MCYRETVQLQVKRKNNLVIQLNAAAFQFIVQKMLPYSKRTTRNREMNQTLLLDAMQNIVQDIFIEDI